MNEEKARQLLQDYIQQDGSLLHLGDYLFWKAGNSAIVLDCELNIQELEAIVWWIKNFQPNI